MVSKPDRKQDIGKTIATDEDEEEYDMLLEAYNGNTDYVVMTLEDGVSVDLQDEQTGLTALHLAAGNNNLELVKILVEEWNASFKPDNFGRWPTLVAAQTNASDELYDYLSEKEEHYIISHGLLPTSPN